MQDLSYNICIGKGRKVNHDSLYNNIVIYSIWQYKLLIHSKRYKIERHSIKLEKLFSYVRLKEIFPIWYLKYLQTE